MRQQKTAPQLLTAALDDEINQGHFQTVRDLLDQGADIDGVDASGRTPLMNAVWVGAADIVNLLVERGASLDSLDRQGRTALQLVRQICREGGGPGHREALKILKAASTEPE